MSVTLHTLTLLASETLVEIPQQLLLLLDYLNDSRHGVKVQVLTDMKILAVRGAHLWTASNVECLIVFLLDGPHLVLQQKVLDVLVTLALSDATTCFTLKSGRFPSSPGLFWDYFGLFIQDFKRKIIYTNETFIAFIDSKLQLVWSRCCYSCNKTVSAKAVQLLVQLVVQSCKKDKCGEAASQEAALAVESLVVTLCSSPPVAEKQLKMALASAVQLSRVSTDISSAIVDCLTQLLPNCNGNAHSSYDILSDDSLINVD